eukprot:9406147-Prorocentrum_lima.AAC.1
MLRQRVVVPDCCNVNNHDEASALTSTVGYSAFMARSLTATAQQQIQHRSAVQLGEDGSDVHNGPGEPRTIPS